MTADFYEYYLKAKISRKLLLAVMNPNKFRTCQFLVQYHEQRNDKVHLSLVYGVANMRPSVDHHLLRQRVRSQALREGAAPTVSLWQHVAERAHADSAEFSV